MCGLLGILRDGDPIKFETLERASRELVHRGPDDFGTWIASNGTVGLAHRRLSIVDLETGHQPLANEAASVHAIVNGEFYDFEQHRSDLEGRGHTFRSASDSEILVHLYEEYGVDCLSRLTGEFAFVLWDDRNRTLFAARDRFGNKPLYFASEHDGLYLASEAKALFAAGVPCRWDRRAFLQNLRLVPSEHQTLFEGVHQVRPGHFLLAQVGSAPRQIRYWDLDFPEQGAERVISDDDAIRHGRDLLEKAVCRRLQGDVPVGVYLSGGIDSSGVIGLAARNLDRPVEAFTVAWHDPDASEENLATETAKYVGANLHVCRVSDDSLAEALPKAVWHSERPANLSAAAKTQLSRFTRDRGVKVVLTGEGADDVYAGYSAFAVDYAGERTDIGTGLDFMRQQLGFVPVWIRRAHRPVDYIRPGLLEEFRGFEPSRAFLEDTGVAERIAGLEPLNNSLYLWSKIRLLNLFLSVMADRTEMSHSVEGRTPYLDQDLVEFGCSLPTSLKIHDGIQKFLLRECVRPVVTDTVYRRKKQGFVAPIRIPQDRLLELYRDTINSSYATELPFFSQPVMKATFDRVVSASQGWLGQARRTKRLRKDLGVLESMVTFGLMQEQFGPT